jgi:PAS domain S-box-containing protein
MPEPLHVLFVEDVATDAELAEREMRLGGLEFVSRRVESGEEFLAALEEFRPDVIISDYTLPSFDGIAALGLAREHLPLVPFILVTGTLSEETAVECMKAGAWDYVLKNRMARLPLAVRGALDLARTRLARAQAEEALRRSEERYRSLFEQSPIGIYRTTPDGRILLANPALLRMLGYAKAEDLSARDLEGEGFEPGYPRQRFKEILERDGEVRSFEAGWTTKDGREVIVHENAHAIRGAGGEILYYEGAVEDITARRQAEEAQQRLAAAVEQAAEAVVITDAGGTIQYVNPAFERVTGYTSGEAIGENPRLLKSSKHDEAFYVQMWSRITSGNVWSGHLTNRRKDGSFYEEEMSISPIRDQHGRIVNYVAVKRDVTREAVLQEQLTQAQKMEAVGRLAGGIAHDFNNLLQAMLSQAAVLRHRLPAGGESLKSLEELEHLILRGASLTRQLLIFSRRGASVREPLDLNDVVRASATLLRRVVRENVSIATYLAEVPLPVLADQGQLDQVLMNLVVNASDAMPEGGRINLRTGEGAEGVWLAVEDTGQGVPEEVREHVFEPFFTTKDPERGTGLGLSVVHGIVSAHGGRADLRSTVGEGTTVTVMLPRSRESAREIVGGSQVAEVAPAGQGERILVVEDEAGARAGLAEILDMLGYAVTAVASGEEAAGRPVQEVYDLLLTDLLLPGMTGAEVVGLLRARWPSIKVVVMSGYTEEEALGGLRSLSGVDFLQKPFDVRALSEILGRAFEAKVG